MLTLFFWCSLIGFSVVVAGWADLHSLQRVPAGTLGFFMSALLGGWILQAMFAFLVPVWWWALLLQGLGAVLLSVLYGRIRWEPYEQE